MRRDNTAWGATPAPSLAWSDSGDPFSAQFEDVYYSRENGLAESRHVFLCGNQLPARWQEQQRDCFCVAETGFGTGLNFLLTWQAWRAHAGRSGRLHFISIEKYPLDRHQLATALGAWPELAELAAELLAAWPGRLPGQHRLIFDSGKVILDLWWEDVSVALPDLAAHGQCVDAWYLDGFAPARNPSMWLADTFASMASLSRQGATVATFTAAGAVRRGLEAAGFSMQKVPGYGRKRESLTGAIAVPRQPQTTPETPWDLDATPSGGKPASALIIGAGLAGATLARALAERDIEVTVLERGTIAGEASGNEQGVLYTRLSRRHSALTDFALQSFRYSASFYRQLFAAGQLTPGPDGQLCGSFHQHSDEQELALMGERLRDLPELAQVLPAEKAAAKLGVRPARPGYWYPDSGWLNPPAVCRTLLDTPGVKVIEHCGELSLHSNTEGWQAQDIRGQCVVSADVAIVCAGSHSSALAGLEWLPLQRIRGQTTLLPESSATVGLRAAFCHQGYISPASRGRHCIGASFKLQDSENALRAEEHKENIDKLLAALPQWHDTLSGLETSSLEGRVGFRCASPDYLPIAGAVPQRTHFLQTYAPLRKNARQFIASRGNYVPGLYVNTAHGSRGLTSAPLCAQVIAARICGEAPPLSRELLRALSPARFLVRDLSRNRI